MALNTAQQIYDVIGTCLNIVTGEEDKLGSLHENE